MMRSWLASRMRWGRHLRRLGRETELGLPRRPVLLVDLPFYCPIQALMVINQNPRLKYAS